MIIQACRIPSNLFLKHCTKRITLVVSQYLFCKFKISFPRFHFDGAVTGRRAETSEDLRKLPVCSPESAQARSRQRSSPLRQTRLAAPVPRASSPWPPASSALSSSRRSCPPRWGWGGPSPAHRRQHTSHRSAFLPSDREKCIVTCTYCTLLYSPQDVNINNQI